MRGASQSPTFNPEMLFREAAALFISTLAFPSHDVKADRLKGHLICTIADQMLEHPDQRGSVSETLRVTSQLRDRKEGETLLRDATRIICSERLIAAKMALPEFHAACCDLLGLTRPKIVPTHCSEEMIAAVSIDLGDPRRQRDNRGRKAKGGEIETDKSNIHNRCWKRSLPVLHMALALRAEISNADLLSFNADDLLADSALIERLIRRSWDNAPIAAKVFNIAEQRILRPFVVKQELVF